MKYIINKFKNLKKYFISEPLNEESYNFYPKKEEKISYDLFLSYSSNDRKAIIEPLYHELKDEGFKPWFDIKEIKWGDSIVKKMQDGIANTKIIIFFISKSYLRKPWTLKELRSIVAMQQVSDTQIIFPILLGITEKELIQSVPFLADIKHLRIEKYNPKEKVEKKYFQEIIRELEEIKDKFEPFKIKSFFHICTLSNPIQVATFGSHYQYYSVKTLHESLEVHIKSFTDTKEETPINLNNLIDTLLKKSNIEETNKIASIGYNPTHSYVQLIVLTSGNFFIIHRMDIHNTPELQLKDYIQTNAPKNPLVSILGRSGEVFLGYEDGSIYTWNGKGTLLKELKAPIVSIDVSFESTFVAVSKSGEIAIWLKHKNQLKNLIKTKNPILSLSVSKTRIRYSKNGLFATGHKNGIVNFWDFDGKNINSYRVANKPIVSISFFPFGLEYLGVATDNNFFILNIITGKIVISLSHNDGNILTSHIGEISDRGLYLFKDDKFKLYITIGCDNGKVFTWELLIS